MTSAPKWTQDFPEVAVPPKRLGGAYQRARSQTCHGDNTDIRPSANEIVLPTMCKRENGEKTGEKYQTSGAIMALNIYCRDGPVAFSSEYQMETAKEQSLYDLTPGDSGRRPRYVWKGGQKKHDFGDAATMCLSVAASRGLPVRLARFCDDWPRLVEARTAATVMTTTGARSGAGLSRLPPARGHGSRRAPVVSASALLLMHLPTFPLCRPLSG